MKKLQKTQKDFIQRFKIKYIMQYGHTAAEVIFERADNKK
mgnify:CR=1 FL=1